MHHGGKAHAERDAQEQVKDDRSFCHELSIPVVPFRVLLC